MSDFWTQDRIAGAQPISTLSLPPLGAFTPWGNLGRAVSENGFAPAEPTAALDPDAIRDEAFAEGFAEGAGMLEQAILDERAAVTALAESLECLRPEPPGPLAALLAETVERLVRQIVGEVEIDRERLLTRAHAAAEVIAEENAPARMRVHPADLDRLRMAELQVELVGDPDVAAGTVLVECDQGWIEDGPGVALDRLRDALDRMGAV
jgi:flagellar assembly protein FliH